MADFEHDIEFGEAPEQMPPSFPPAPQNLKEKTGSGSARENIGADDPGVPAEAEEKAFHDINKLEENADYPKQRKKKSFLANLFEFVMIFAVTLAAAVLLKTFIVQPFEIPSGSMADTLLPDDRILVNKLADTEDELNRGDIVVFVDPGGWLDDVQQPEISGVKKALVTIGEAVGLIPKNAGMHLVKRLIGKPGDHIVCCTVEGNLTINGSEVKEPYLINGATASDIPFDVIVPEGHLWMMGDNRPGSKDSRYHQTVNGFGFVPIENVEGRAWLRVYPFSRFAKLPSQEDVFKNVKDASVKD